MLPDNMVEDAVVSSPFERIALSACASWDHQVLVRSIMRDGSIARTAELSITR